MWRFFRAICGLVVVASGATQGSAQPASLDARVGQVAGADVVASAIGVTRKGTAIPCLLSPDHNDLDHGKTRVLLVGGMAGSVESVESVEAVLAAVAWFHTAAVAAELRTRYSVSAVPCVNVDGWPAGLGPGNTSGGDPTRGYPPRGNAYSSKTDPESAYLWRWIGMYGPDLVVDVRARARTAWRVPASDDAQLNRLADVLRPVQGLQESDSLVHALTRVAPSNVGTVRAVRVDVPMAAGAAMLRGLLDAMGKAKFAGPSAARQELQRRLARSPLEVAKQLSVRYGHDLKSVSYIPALALIGRVRVGALTKDPAPLADVRRIVAPYVLEQKPALSARASGSNLAGHLVFGYLARQTNDPSCVKLVRAAADLAFDENGEPREAMPSHVEMSDAVFMGGPILAQAGRLTGEAKYFDMCVRHIRFMRRLVLRPDGIYRHSPLDEAAWGRGNGFPALGLALCLTDLPANHAGRAEMLVWFRAHLEALTRHQDPTGAWHQVIDLPGSYRELTSTCMITFAMVRGVRRGWLDEKKYGPVIERAWHAIRTRVAPDGTLVDVCTGTGKQKNLRAYLDRTAILGPDPRGGAMALMVTTELAVWAAERAAR